MNPRTVGSLFHSGDRASESGTNRPTANGLGRREQTRLLAPISLSAKRLVVRRPSRQQRMLMATSSAGSIYILERDKYAPCTFVMAANAILSQ